MSNTKETLSQVLQDVSANRKSLADQLQTQKQQLEIGEAQLVKFDQLIASLQVVTADEALLSKTDDQHAVNVAAGSQVSPTVPAAANS